MALTSEQLVEQLKLNSDAINRGDFDSAIQLADPDIVFVRPGGLPQLRGAEAVRAWMEPDAFESQRYELLDHQAEGNRVLTRQRTIAKGAGSGIEMEIESLSVWTFSDEGKVTRVEAFTPAEEDAARRALRDG
ncbi:MAG TPA: nuclear transport factor 2 family protein [Solirubrobacterales bacterium]|nr:nuclear transport factor 2 family protein [Solirubrobacterales bacterium]